MTVTARVNRNHSCKVMHVNINKIIHVLDQTCHAYHQTCDLLPKLPCVFTVTETHKDEFNSVKP